MLHDLGSQQIPIVRSHFPKFKYFSYGRSGVTYNFLRLFLRRRKFRILAFEARWMTFISRKKGKLSIYHNQKDFLYTDHEEAASLRTSEIIKVLFLLVQNLTTLNFSKGLLISLKSCRHRFSESLSGSIADSH